MSSRYEMGFLQDVLGWFCNGQLPSHPVDVVKVLWVGICGRVVGRAAGQTNITVKSLIVLEFVQTEGQGRA